MLDVRTLEDASEKVLTTHGLFQKSITT